jgi:RNA polymerase sigma-70 factor (ECF subfamily)
MRVTRNHCLDRLRRRRPTQEWQEWQQPDDSHGPMQDLQQHELGEWLKRSLVVLRDVQQHSYEEVANVLELSLTQVKVYLHRARKQLRKQLAEVRP